MPAALLTWGAIGLGRTASASRRAAEPSRSSLTVASLNMARQSELQRVSREVLSLRARRQVDVLFLQEVQRDAGEAPMIADELAEALQFSCLFETTDYWNDGGSQGLAILSRYPLKNVEVIPLKHFDLVFKQRHRIGLAATIQTPRGPVRIINAHLDSRINTSHRLEQLAAILDSAARFDGMRVIGGDFNTNDFRWLTPWLPIPFGARQEDAVREAFQARGYETPREC